MKFGTLLVQNIDSVLLVVVLSLCMNKAYVWSAQYTDDIETRFRHFLVKYNRTYATNSTEYAKRLAIFAVSLAGSVTFTEL